MRPRFPQSLEFTGFVGIRREANDTQPRLQQTSYTSEVNYVKVLSVRRTPSNTRLHPDAAHVFYELRPGGAVRVANMLQRLDSKFINNHSVNDCFFPML